MLLQRPDEFAFDNATVELIADVKAMTATMNDFRPLQKDVLDEIQKSLLEDRVFNSNAIEGNTLGLRETQRILEAGAVIDVSKRREATEVLNLGAAIQRIQSFVNDESRWSDESSFLEVHKLLMTGIRDDIAGMIRIESVIVTGAKHQPPAPEQIKGLLDEFLSTLRRSVHIDPIRLATWAHWAIARIHPFEDGNGRMARLWQDLVLFGRQYTAAVIRASTRKEYYKALTDADDGKFDPLAQMIGQSVAETLQSYLNACREHDDQKDWARELVGEAHAVVAEQRRLEYLRWTRGMHTLLDAFQRCATQITTASDGTIEVQVRPFIMIDQPTWESLRSGVGAAKTSYFWVNFRKGVNRLQYCFFFGHHYYHEADQQLALLGPSASLLISEQQGFDNAVRVDEIRDLPVTLREVIVLDGQLVQRLVNPVMQGSDGSKQAFVYRQNANAMAIAQTFIKEVLLGRLR